MRAAWYENQGAARDVLVVGEMPDPSHSTTPSPENKSILRRRCRLDSHRISRFTARTQIGFRLSPSHIPTRTGNESQQKLSCRLGCLSVLIRQVAAS